jgi:hypothetical protein
MWTKVVLVVMTLFMHMCICCAQNAAWSNPYIDIGTLIVAADVTLDIPYSGGSYQFVMVGTTASIPYTTQCPQKNTPLVPWSNLCATRLYNELIPYSCPDSAHNGPAITFTQTDLAANVYEIVPDALFVEDTTTVEIKMGTLGTGFKISNKTHYHYDVKPVATGFSLANNECFLKTGSTAECTLANYTNTADVRGNWPDQPQQQPDTRRIHTAKIVPYYTFPTSSRMTFHFQYRMPQLARDCAQSVVMSPIYGTNGYVLGFSYKFSLTVGLVNSKTVTTHDTRTYDVRLLTNSLSGRFVSYAFFLISGSLPYYTVDVYAGGSPLAVYDATGTAARMVFSLKMVFTSNGFTAPSVTALPRNNVTRTVFSDAFQFLSTNCLSLSLQSISPIMEGGPVTDATAFCPTGTVCQYLVVFTTPMVTLLENGTTFTSGGNTTGCIPGQYAVRFSTAQCTRNATSHGFVSSCRATTATTYMDELSLSLNKYVYPRHSYFLQQFPRGVILTTATPTYSMMLTDACTNVSRAVGSTSTAPNACTDVSSTLPTSGTDMSVVFAWERIDQWPGVVPTLVIDTTSIVFQISGYIADTSTITPFLRILSPASNPTVWAAFRASWLTQPRNASSSLPRLSLVSSYAGMDGFSLPYESLRTYIASDIPSRFVIQTLIVSAFVTPYSQLTASRRLLQETGEDDDASTLYARAKIHVQTSSTFLSFSTPCVLTSGFNAHSFMSSVPCTQREPDSVSWWFVSMMTGVFLASALATLSFLSAKKYMR